VTRPRPRRTSTQSGGPERAPESLAGLSIGIVPIVWNNADLADLAPRVEAATVMDEVARLGFDGLQDGIGFPSGRVLRAALAKRGLRLAEVYAALPCSVEGPDPEAIEIGRRRLNDLHEAGGDVLVVALGFSPGRLERAGRADSLGTPILTASGWKKLASALETLGTDAAALGHPLAFHSHAGTFVETPAELARLTELTDPALVGLCLDTGHTIFGGGDPLATLRRYGRRIVHVHMKDVAAEPLEALRAGRLTGFLEALRARIFTELGGGVLPVAALLDELADRDYAGWLMVEQDTTWNPPSESAAISRRVLEFALRLRSDAGAAA
jgi:inosose dehydratase